MITIQIITILYLKNNNVHLIQINLSILFLQLFINFYQLLVYFTVYLGSTKKILRKVFNQIINDFFLSLSPRNHFQIMLKILIKIVSLLISRIHFRSRPFVFFGPSLFFLMQSSSTFWENTFVFGLGMSIQSSITQVTLPAPANIVPFVVVVLAPSFSLLFLLITIFVFDNIAQHFVVRIVSHGLNGVNCSSLVRNSFWHY